MKTPISLLALVCFAGAASIGPIPAAEPRQPNLVILFTDDLGYADIGPYGCRDIPTPHLDALAAGGTRFTNAYTAAPICVPSRMALMTGKFPARFGLYDNEYTPEENRIWLEQTTLADVLKRQGYRTANVGKWHLSGNGDGFRFKPPHECGFDEFVGITGGMVDFWKGAKLVRLQDGGYEPFESPEYLTDFFGAEGCAFIERNKSRPFFLYLAFTAPHAPLQGLDEDQAAIEAADSSPDRRKYGAMVRAVDRSVGRVLDTLRTTGLLDDTIVVFLNDNGGGGNNVAGHTRNTAINRPFRGHKFDVWEGGMRIPFILHWPGRVPAGKVSDGVISSMDIFPTFAAAAGAQIPKDVDGVDLMPFVRGDRAGDVHETLCWQQKIWSRPNERKPGPGFPKPAFNLAIRSGHWKAVNQDQPFAGDAPGRGWELYDLRRDPAELNDLASEFPAKVAELEQAFFAWQRQMPKPVQPEPTQATPARVR